MKKNKIKIFFFNPHKRKNLQNSFFFEPAQANAFYSQTTHWKKLSSSNRAATINFYKIIYVHSISVFYQQFLVKPQTGYTSAEQWPKVFFSLVMPLLNIDPLFFLLVMPLLNIRQKKF